MYAAKNTATKSNTNLVNILKFAIATILGFLLVVIPFNFDGTVDTISFYYLKLLKSSLGNVLTFTVVSVVALSGIVSLITLLFKPKFILENKTLKSLFSTTPFYVANRLIGGLIAILCFFN
ncbi:MAG TPA: arginine transporter, partial [Terrisporobacter glycolicus]|nr:arginine transporter [Terrisporobacter hibernicus]